MSLCLKQELLRTCGRSEVELVCEAEMLVNLISLAWRIFDLKCVKLLSSVLVTPIAEK